MNANGAPLDGVLIADFSRVLAGPRLQMISCTRQDLIVNE